jgi:hypothetical protein
VFCRHIAAKAMLQGTNEILSVGWLPYQPSDTFEDDTTPVFDWALVIVIPSNLPQSV